MPSKTKLPEQGCVDETVHCLQKTEAVKRGVDGVVDEVHLLQVTPHVRRWHDVSIPVQIGKYDAKVMCHLLPLRKAVEISHDSITHP